MKSLQVRRLLCLCCLCVLEVFSLVHGQGRDQSFNLSMSLEETMVWLGKQLKQQRSEVSHDGRYVWSRGTRLIEAKGCTLSYWSTIETDGLEPVSPGYRVRELWTLDLGGLDPARINAQPNGRVWFWAMGDTRNAIRKSNFNREDRLNSATYNAAMGNFWVRDKVKAESVASALKHAVDLCRVRKQ